MKKTNLWLALTVGFALLIQACGTKNQSQENSSDSTFLYVGDNSHVSVDWNGVYKGLLPCADCGGIHTYLKLEDDNTYVLKTKYMDKDTTVFVETGKFTWSDDGSKITLDGDSQNQYLVGENQVFQLDREGNRITGALEENYRLAKVDTQIQNVYWKLIEINGQSLQNIKLMKEPYLRLNTLENRAEANGGCNGMGATFVIDEENSRLSFSQLIGTQMACENMEIEQQLGQILQQVDSYNLHNDTLQLFKARMAPLAKYVAVYDKF